MSYQMWALAFVRGIASALQTNQKSLLPSVPRIDTYVINLDDRKDRCSCMEKQLRSAPQAVYRVAASKGQDCGLKVADDCDGGERFEGEQGLFCSNFNIWTRANGTYADFILILEDDVTLSGNFWERLVSMLQSCSKFDYLIVDAHGQDPPKGPTCDTNQHYQLLNANCTGRNPKYCNLGTHVQVIRADFLPKLIASAQAIGGGAMDFWWKRHAPGRSFVWKPNIAGQAVNAGVLDFCDDSILASDIRRNRAHSGAPKSLHSPNARNLIQLGARPARLQCPL